MPTPATKRTSSAQRRDATINLRLLAQARDLIDTAASVSGTTRTDRKKGCCGAWAMKLAAAGPTSSTRVLPSGATIQIEADLVCVTVDMLQAGQH